MDASTLHLYQREALVACPLCFPWQPSRPPVESIADPLTCGKDEFRYASAHCYYLDANSVFISTNR